MNTRAKLIFVTAIAGVCLLAVTAVPAQTAPGAGTGTSSPAAPPKPPSGPTSPAKPPSGGGTVSPTGSGPGEDGLGCGHYPNECPADVKGTRCREKIGEDDKIVDGCCTTQYGDDNDGNEVGCSCVPLADPKDRCPNEGGGMSGPAGGR